MNNTFERAQAIVEELRADIDFELDDVITKIVQGLPDDYFTSLSPADQLKPLKALLALGICQINDEIMMRSDDGRQIAVVANQNYPGQLSDILHRLPAELPLTGAKIFTSTDHDFIIDVFDFRSAIAAPENAITPADVAHLVNEVARSTGHPSDVISEFVSHYPPASAILETPGQVAEQFLAYNEVEHSTDTAILWTDATHDQMTRVTISAGQTTARHLFQATAAFLGMKKTDIDRAWLHDIPRDPELKTHVAIASFLLTGQVAREVDALRSFLGDQRGSID